MLWLIRQNSKFKHIWSRIFLPVIFNYQAIKPECCGMIWCKSHLSATILFCITFIHFIIYKQYVTLPMINVLGSKIPWVFLQIFNDANNVSVLVTAESSGPFTIYHHTMYTDHQMIHTSLPLSVTPTQIPAATPHHTMHVIAQTYLESHDCGNPLWSGDGLR